MTQLFDRPIEGPATHAFIVGCGRYPFLGAHQSANRKAPVAGALAFARMLLESQDCLIAPLGSLELLLSDPAVDEGAVDIGDKLGPVLNSVISPANEENYRERGDRWLKKIRPGDVAVFYFSGHGISDRSGGAVGLLEDIKSKSNRPWAQSFGVYNLLMGLRTLAAESAWLFFDACREIVDEFADRLWTVNNIDLKEVTLADVVTDTCVPLAMAATGVGGKAWAPIDDEPPFFTQVLLKGLSGCCVEKTSAHGWAITGRSLLFDLAEVSDAILDGTVVKPQSIYPYSERKALMKIAQPFTPLAVRSDPEAHLKQASIIRVMHGDVELHSSAEAQYVWRVDVSLEERDLTVNCISQGGIAILAPQTFRQRPPVHTVVLIPVGGAA